MGKRNKVLAVVVIYNPPLDIEENIKAISEQVDRILIIDNKDTGLEENNSVENIYEKPFVSVIQNNNNLGIATALNQGFQWAIAHDFEYVLTLDQDSFSPPLMVQELLEVYHSHPRGANIAIVAPNIIDDAVNIRPRYLRPTSKVSFEFVSCEQGWLEDVVFVITSGSLFKVSSYQKIGPFCEAFFIDYVDVEYCLRAHSLGYELIVACDTTLTHSLGKRQEKKFFGRKEYPRFHSPKRWYFQSRNRIQVLIRYFSEYPYLVSYEILNTSYGFLRMLLFENQRWEKMKAIVRGTLHGLFNNMNND